jgi:hypothetical protein
LKDFGISGDNAIKQEAGKIKKKAIKAEVILIVKTKVISVIKGATGTISKSCKKKYPSNIHVKHEIKELQKSTGHSTYFGKYPCKRMNRNCRIATTLYTLETSVVSGV